MAAKKQNAVQSQQEFLREAMSALGMTRAAFAKRISVPEKTLDKWMAPASTADFRNMPEVVWAYVREILRWEVKGT
jgi:predicted transcriptional regulator